MCEFKESKLKYQAKSFVFFVVYHNHGNTNKVGLKSEAPNYASWNI